MEEFDLKKYNYEDNIFKILIANVNKIFLYWNITDEYNNKFIEKYGEDFFEKTKQIITIVNLTNNEKDIIELEEETNNYYWKIKYSNSIYQAKLIRIGIEDGKDFEYKLVSNKIKTQNTRILIDRFNDKNIRFKNIKNNKYVEHKEVNIEEVKRLYDENMLVGWNEYKRENGYLE